MEGEYLDAVASREYKEFIKEEIESEKLTFYEKICIYFSKKPLNLQCPKPLKGRLDKAIFLVDFKISSDNVFSATINAFILSFLMLLPLSLLLQSFFLKLLALFLPFFIAYNILSFPIFYSDVIRIKAGNEMVSVILYMSIYLFLNPSLLGAYLFAAVKCSGPLGRDLKKMIWDLEVNVYQTLREAVAHYSKKWDLWNSSFVDSLETLSFVETTPLREKFKIIREALDNVLRGSLEQMRGYAKAIRTPLFMIHAFGIMLPAFSLVIFPIISLGVIKEISVSIMAFGWLVVLPSLLFWILYRTLSKRPGAFTSSPEYSLDVDRYIEIFGRKIPIWYLAIGTGILIALPGILHYLSLFSEYRSVFSKYPPVEAKDIWAKKVIAMYEEDVVFKHILVASTLPMGICAAIVLGCYLRSYRKKKLRDFIRFIERDFENCLLELSHVLKKKIPIEVALQEVIAKYERLNLTDKPTYKFFRETLEKIANMGVPFSDAFKSTVAKYPSKLIQEVVNLILSALEKSPYIASLASSSIAVSLRNIHRVEEALKDMLDQVLFTLRTLTSFVLPLICGIVAAMFTWIIIILQKIVLFLQRIEQQLGAVGGGVTSGLSNTLGFLFFDLRKAVPPSVFFLIISLYLIETTLILVYFMNGVEVGFDKIEREYKISKQLLSNFLFFLMIVFISLIVFKPLSAGIEQIG